MYNKNFAFLICFLHADCRWMLLSMLPPIIQAKSKAKGFYELLTSKLTIHINLKWYVCFRKQFEIEEAVISINTTKQTVDKCKQPIQEIKLATIDQLQPKMPDKREKTPVGSNPFGTPEESPERDSNNPFGEPTDDDYDSELNPFAE